MTDHPHSLVIDCSGKPGQEHIDKFYAEAMEFLKEGKVQTAENLLAQIKRLEGDMREGPIETLVPFTPEQMAQRELDEVEAHKAYIEMLRSERNARLAACDWTDLPHAPLTDEQKASWQKYRQELRDCMADCNPSSHEWPTPPG